MGAIAYLAWHLRQLYVLQQWLEHRKQRPRPQARGAWVPVLDSLERLNRQSRKRKRRLRNFVRRFEHAAAAFPDAAVILRIDGGIVWLNQAATELLGLRHPQDLNQPISKLIRNPLFVEYLEQVAASRNRWRCLRRSTTAPTFWCGSCPTAATGV